MPSPIDLSELELFTYGGFVELLHRQADPIEEVLTLYHDQFMDPEKLAEEDIPALFYNSLEAEIIPLLGSIDPTSQIPSPAELDFHPYCVGALMMETVPDLFSHLENTYRLAKINYEIEYNKFKDHIERAGLLGRLVLLEKSQGTYRDGTRKYSGAPAFSHILNVGNLVFYMTGDPLGYLIGLGHDTTEEFKPLDRLAREIKELLSEHSPTQSAELSDKMEKYQALRQDTLERVVNYIFADEESESKDRFARGIDTLTPRPDETYEEYIDRVFSSDDSLVIVTKLSDKLHNISTDFNYRENTSKLGKRIQSFRETQILIDRTKKYLVEKMFDALGFSEDERGLFLEYMRKTIPEQEDDQPRLDAYSVLLDRIERADLHKLASEGFAHIDAIYSLHVGLAEAFHDDYHELWEYITGDFVKQIAEHDQEAMLADLKQIKIPQVENEILRYYELGGFLQRTPKGWRWPDEQTSSLDGFLTRIDEMIRRKSFVKQSDIFGILEGIAPFGCLAHMYKGLAYNGRYKIDITPQRGLSLVYLGAYP